MVEARRRLEEDERKLWKGLRMEVGEGGGIRATNAERASKVKEVLDFDWKLLVSWTIGARGLGPSH